MHKNAQLKEIKQINNMLSIDGKEDIQLVTKVTGVSVHVLNMETLEKSIVVNSKLRNARIVGQYQGTMEELFDNIATEQEEKEAEATTIKEPRIALTQDKNGEQWIINIDTGYMTNRRTGEEQPINQNLFRKNTSASIKGEWHDLGAISAREINDNFKTLAEGTAIFNYEGVRYEKEFKVMFDHEEEEILLMKYTNENVDNVTSDIRFYDGVSICYGFNSTLAAYCATLPIEVNIEMFHKFGFTYVGDNLFQSKDMQLDMGEFKSCKKITRGREVSIRSKLDEIREKAKSTANKELEKLIGA